MRGALAAMLVAALGLPAVASAQPAVMAGPAPTASIEAEIARIAALAEGLVGVAAWRLDGEGRRVAVNADQRFPMASAFKIAVAGAVLAQVDAGTLGLGQMAEVYPDQHVSSDIIADRLIHPGVSLSVHNLLELMLTQSDNTATDVLMGLVGGPATVTAWVRAQGIRDIRVDRDTAGVLRDFFGLAPGPFAAAFDAGVRADPELEARGSLRNSAYDDDPRDTSTPNATAELLDRIFTGRALSPESTAVMIATMERNRTGGSRIKARLPDGVTVADKTGTLGGSVNDVGVITLPGRGGRIVLAVFIKKSDVPFAARERVIADIARLVYDVYVLGGLE